MEHKDCTQADFESTLKKHAHELVESLERGQFGDAVQLIASAKRVPPKDRQFKSYRGKVTEFVTGGRFRYKYCVGRFDTRKQAEAKLAEVRREFRDAFVVSCRGDRIVQ